MFPPCLRLFPPTTRMALYARNLHKHKHFLSKVTLTSIDGDRRICHFYCLKVFPPLKLKNKCLYAENHNIVGLISQ